jgi:hypothetical protein
MLLVITSAMARIANSTALNAKERPKKALFLNWFLDTSYGLLFH